VVVVNQHGNRLGLYLPSSARNVSFSKQQCGAQDSALWRLFCQGYPDDSSNQTRELRTVWESSSSRS